LGEIQQAHRQFADAERDYRKAISLLSRHPERSHALATVWRNLAAALTAQAHYGDDLAARKEASKLVAKKKVEDPCQAQHLQTEARRIRASVVYTVPVGNAK